MSVLRSYYTAASQAVRSASSGTMTVVMHDAFYGPSYWASYDPLSASSNTPAGYILLDTHQYYAFAPLGNLPQAEILERICNTSKLLRGERTRYLPNTVVGEWSLESGSGHDAAASNNPSSQEKRTWLRKFFEAQMAAYVPNGNNQPGRGFYYWTCECHSINGLGV